MTRCVIILDHVDGSTFGRVALNQRQAAVGAEGFDGLGSSVKIIVVNFTLKDAVRVFLNEVHLTIVVAIAFDEDELIVVERLGHIRPTIAVGVYRDLISFRSDPADPLIGPAIMIPMSDNEPGTAAA